MTRNNFIFSGFLFATILFIAGCEQPDPEQLRQRQLLPGLDFVADAQTGDDLFHAHCARCHGNGGTGTDQGPSLIDNIYRPGHHADLAFHWAAKDGVKQHHWHFGDMPAIPAVSPQEVGHIIAYVRDEQRQAGIR